MKLQFRLSLVLILLVAFSGIAFAHSSYLDSFNSTYGTTGTRLDTCALCHLDPAGGGTRNGYGNDYRNHSHSFAAIEPLDSDGDGYANITEIHALKFPGDPNDKPSGGGDTTAPTVTSFSIPSTSSSLTVPITSFTASDNIGVTGYIVTESSSKPASNSAGWSGTPPTSHTFGSAGTKTLYAWAKDNAGNVSAGKSASVTITLPASDTTPPTVTSFSIPSTSSSLTVPITNFTAMDDTGVTGYMVTEGSAKPSSGSGGWSGTAPTSYTFGSAGTKTLYAWAKDNAGNVSAGMSATVTITLLPGGDTTPPTVVSFSIPSTSSSLNVSVISFTATDNTGVTGYMVTESAMPPSADAANWSGTAPTNYTFGSEGMKTLYAWAKDAAGNVSSSASASIDITLVSGPGSQGIAAPAGDQKFYYDAVETPVVDSDPALARPIGFGPMIAGGDNADVWVNVAFAVPMDISFGLYQTAVDTMDMYLLDSSKEFKLLSEILTNDSSVQNSSVSGSPLLWKTGVTEVNEEVFSGPIPLSQVSPGLYVLFLRATPSDGSGGSYDWSTSVIVE